MTQSSLSHLGPDSVGPVGPHRQSTRPASVGDNSEISLVDLVALLQRGKWVIAGSVCAMLIVAMYYTRVVAVPTYSASAILALEVRNQSLVDIQGVMSGVSSDQTSLNTELEVIKSRKLMEQLVVDLNLIQDPEFNRALAAAPSSGLLSSLKMGLSRFLNGVDDAERSERDRPKPEQDVVSATANAVAGAVRVESLRGTYVFNITATTQDPAKSQRLANHLAQIYLDDQIGVKFDAIEFAVSWLSLRVSELEQEIVEKQAAISKLRASSEMISVDALEALNVRAKRSRDRLQALSQRVAEAQADVLETRAYFDTGNFAAVVGTARSEFGPEQDEPSDIPLRDRALSILQDRRDALALAQSQLESIQSSYDILQDQIAAQFVDSERLNQLTREADATKVLYETFLTRLKETTVQIGMQKADSRVLSPAIAGVQVSPRSDMIMPIAAIIGMIFGSLVVVLRQILQTGFRTAQELEQGTGLPVLGQIPRMPLRKRQGLFDYLKLNQTSAAAEALRSLRLSVLMASSQQGCRVIMVSSSVPGEGKTTLSLGLAMSLSLLNKRVLLVEGDIRRRTLNQYFRDLPRSNLLDVLDGNARMEDAILRVDDIDIDVLMGPGTAHRNVDRFSTGAFPKLLDQARELYDVVIVDTPPVLVVPDARAIAQHADTLIYAVLWNRTSPAQVSEGLRQFYSTGSIVTGLVMSNVDARGMKRYGHGALSGAYADYGNRYYNQS